MDGGLAKGAVAGVILGVGILALLLSPAFLTLTPTSAGGQQGSQNQAAQSSITIETATFVTGTTSAKMTLIVRNVGAVPVTLASISVTSASSNLGFRGDILVAIPLSGSVTVLASEGIAWAVSPSGVSSYQNSPKGSAIAVTFEGPASPGNTKLAPGDSISIKVVTTVGTFATSQFTVPNS